MCCEEMRRSACQVSNWYILGKRMDKKLVVFPVPPVFFMDPFKIEKGR